MKKVIVALLFVVAISSCTKETNDEQESLNQIESVDGTKIKRPGSGGGN